MAQMTWRWFAAVTALALLSLAFLFGPLVQSDPLGVVGWFVLSLGVILGLVALGIASFFTRSNAYVTSGDEGTLRVLALDGREIRMTKVPRGSYNVQRASDRILTPSLDEGTLCILDTHGRLLRRLQVAPSSHDACLLLTA
jgi:hypothetical protein